METSWTTSTCAECCLSPRPALFYVAFQPASHTATARESFTEISSARTSCSPKTWTSKLEVCFINVMHVAIYIASKFVYDSQQDYVLLHISSFLLFSFV